MPPPMTPKIAHHHWTKKSEIAITTRVGPGRSAPKLLNKSLNAGITKTMITAVMTNATTIMETG
jgi:NAD/NADP transhydrogenase alpha subunit